MTRAYSFCSACSYLVLLGESPGRPGASCGFKPAFCIACSIDCCNLRASLIASRTCSWNLTCSVIAASVTPSAATRGSDINWNVRVIVWPPDVSRTLYFPGGTMGPPGPPVGVCALQDPG